MLFLYLWYLCDLNSDMNNEIFRYLIVNPVFLTFENPISGVKNAHSEVWCLAQCDVDPGMMQSLSSICQVKSSR